MGGFEHDAEALSPALPRARRWPPGRHRGLASREAARVAGLTGLEATRASSCPRCRSVHTAGMRFALDLVWLDAGGAVVRVDRGVQPFRMRSCREARSVVEVAAGRGDAFAEALAKPGSVAPPGW